MKHQALFSLKNKGKKIKVSSAAIFFFWCFKGYIQIRVVTDSAFGNVIAHFPVMTYLEI